MPPGLHYLQIRGAYGIVAQIKGSGGIGLWSGFEILCAADTVPTT
jgi:hypothetical protein